jgi:hypothetical protein
MGTPDRPPLTLEQQVGIETAQQGVDERFWQFLWSFQALLPHAQEEYNPRLNRLNPPIPKEPAKFQLVVSEYAKNLFMIESGMYSADAPELKEWLEGLGERIVERISNTLDDIEGKGYYQSRSFAHHDVGPEQLLATMRETIRKLIEKQLQGWISRPPLPPEVMRQMHGEPHRGAIRADVSQEPATVESEVDRRAKLLAEYKLATGNPPDLRLYTASNSGIHKPEFYQWRDGRLPAKSRVTKRFEAFLKAKKKPIPKNPTNH